MLKKLLKKKFANKIFTWGRNLNNCGYEVQNISEGVLPVQLEKLDLDVKKFVSGYSESFVLTKDGQLYQFGHQCLLPKNSLKPSLYQTSEQVIDCDLNSTDAAVLLKSGKVQLINTLTGENEIQIDNAKMIACGKNFYVAVVRENNRDKIVMWANEVFYRGLFIFGNTLPKTYLQEIESINQILSKENSNVKKLQVVEESIAMLLENGSLYTWGNNSSGNLGLKRTMCAGEDELVNSNPQQPLSFINNSDKVLDFALSENMLVVLTEKHEAFWCGLDKNFYLQKIETLNNKKVQKIGASFNNFMIVTEDNRTFAREPLPEQEYPIYWGAQQLYEYSQEHFNNAQIQQMGGKYDNSIMIA